MWHLHTLVRSLTRALLALGQDFSSPSHFHVCLGSSGHYSACMYVDVVVLTWPQCLRLSPVLLQAPQCLRSPALALCVCLPCIPSSGEAKIALPSLLMKHRTGDLIPVIASLLPLKGVIPKAMVILESSNAS